VSRIVEWPDREEQRDGLAHRVGERLRAALAARGRASLAVPGGTTPGPFLWALAQLALDWARVSVMLTDERFLPEDSPRSNTALLRRTLLQGPAAAATLVPVTAPADLPEHVTGRLTQAIEAALPLDVCVLGMGTDGHIASLFPGADRLALALSEEAPPLLALRAPGVPEPRLTLTLPVLLGARHLFLLIAGAEKKAALRRAEAGGPVSEAPVRAILERAEIHYAP
jgi:6-phosphogluconolactonase